MLSILALDTLKYEDVSLAKSLKTAFENRELPIKRLSLFSDLEKLSNYYDDNKDRFNVFIALFSDCLDEYLEFARKFKIEQNEVFIVFIVDKNASISSYVRPSIKPSSILFIPPEKTHLYQVINEIYAEYLRENNKEKSSVFKIKSGSDYFNVDTSDIFFFESQGKKIALKTAGQEISFYSNFDSVLEQLPSEFIRCHKGFVVNIKRVVQANFTDMVLILKDKSAIPVSRTYKDKVKLILEQGVNYE